MSNNDETVKRIAARDPTYAAASRKIDEAVRSAARLEEKIKLDNELEQVREAIVAQSKPHPNRRQRYRRAILRKREKELVELLAKVGRLENPDIIRARHARAMRILSKLNDALHAIAPLVGHRAFSQAPKMFTTLSLASWTAAVVREGIVEWPLMLTSLPSQGSVTKALFRVIDEDTINVSLVGGMSHEIAVTERGVWCPWIRAWI